MVNMYDAATLSPLGEAKLQCGDIFSGAGPCQQVNKYFPLITDGENLCIVTMKVTTKKKAVKPEKQEAYDRMILRKKEE